MSTAVFANITEHQQRSSLDDGSSLEHFARTVSPRNWQNVYILMLTVCFDAAGKEDSEQFVVVAGFAGMAKVWSEFEIAWQNRLDKDDLPYFHSGDFAHFRDPLFSRGWKDNEPRRQRLCRDLMRIICDHGLRKFGTVINLDTHRTIDEALRTTFLLDAYVQGARCSVITFNNYAKGIGINRNVRYVFEKGDREHELRQRFQTDGLIDPDYTWKSRHVDDKGFVHDGFLGLQAAGWIAYECFLDLKRRNDKYDRIRDPRWAFTQFDRLLGQIEVQTVEAAKGNELLMRVAEQTTYLSDLKPKSFSMVIPNA